MQQNEWHTKYSPLMRQMASPTHSLSEGFASMNTEEFKDLLNQTLDSPEMIWKDELAIDLLEFSRRENRVFNVEQEVMTDK